jgi:pimeloyl-ACP methyl ester carboxylesterase
VTAPTGESPLIGELGRGLGRPLDAVIVPVCRSAENLTTAAAIAAKAGSTLLALCDGQAKAAGDVADREGVWRWHAVDVPREQPTALLAFPEPATTLPERGGRVLASRKRNLGLLVARMLGWRTVLFLDDDIRGLDASEVCFATAGLHTAATVGFAVEDWSDHSVVSRAHQLSSVAEDLLVGAAALIVDPTAPLLGHFPAIHNADRLFLYDALVHRKVQRAPEPVQRARHDALTDLRRAGAEEFGEVIGAGLVAYARHRGRWPVPLYEAYWREFLECRREFLAGVVRKLEEGSSSPRRLIAARAVRTAERRHEVITPTTCVRFYQHWRRERRIWQERLARLQPAKSVGEALHMLGLEPARLTPARLSRIGGLPGGPPITMMKYATPGADMLAVVVPGFLDNGSGPGAATLAKAIQEQGHTAITFDPRGTWRSKGDFRCLTPDVQADDVSRVVGSERRYRRVALVGHSLGALVACLAASRDERITDVVAIMPPRCFVWANDYDPNCDRWGAKRRITVAHGQMSWAFDVPHSVVEKAVAHSLPPALARLDERVRILFVAGTEDTVIPVDAVRRLHDECGTSHKTMRVLAVGHDYQDRPDHLRLVNASVLKWLDGAVGLPRAPAASPAPERSPTACHPA